MLIIQNIEVLDQNFHYNKKEALEALKKEFGQQFSESKSVREQHTDTTTIHTSRLPDGVVFAENENADRPIARPRWLLERAPSFIVIMGPATMRV